MKGYSCLKLASLLLVLYLNDTEATIPSLRAGIFDLVKFPNDVCDGTGYRNGTCYTAAECTEKGGTTDGACAEGYGVCCIFSIGCGQSTNENITYILGGDDFMDSDASCEYNICRCSSDVCRVKLEFNTHAIGPPVIGTAFNLAGAANAAMQKNPNAIGDCTGDSFIVSGTNTNIPMICGENSGQHIFLDMADGCANLHFNLVSAQSMTSRRWDIRVVQYVCGDTNAGPENCLQYHMGVTGAFRSFNYPSNFPTVTTTHLSNQDYAICIRRDAAACYICYNHFLQDGCDAAEGCANAVAEVTTVSAGPTFGISVDNGAAAKANVDTHCSSDYLLIPGGTSEAIAKVGTDIPTCDGAAANVDFCEKYLFCGRFLSTDDDVAVNNGAGTVASVCTRQEPFYVWFHTDADELTNNAGGDSLTNELVGFPQGTQGFHLEFTQRGQCT